MAGSARLKSVPAPPARKPTCDSCGNPMEHQPQECRECERIAVDEFHRLHERHAEVRQRLKNYEAKIIEANQELTENLAAQRAIFERSPAARAKAEAVFDRYADWITIAQAGHTIFNH